MIFFIECQEGCGRNGVFARTSTIANSRLGRLARVKQPTIVNLILAREPGLVPHKADGTYKELAPKDKCQSPQTKGKRNTPKQAEVPARQETTPTTTTKGKRNTQSRKKPKAPKDKHKPQPAKGRRRTPQGRQKPQAAKRQTPIRHNHKKEPRQPRAGRSPRVPNNKHQPGPPKEKHPRAGRSPWSATKTTRTRSRSRRESHRTKGNTSSKISCFHPPWH